MSNLEPIKFSKYNKISAQQDKVLEIQNCIYKLSNIQVKVRKFQPPHAIISTSTASAASELHLLKSTLIIELEKYNITQLTITIG